VGCSEYPERLMLHAQAPTKLPEAVSHELASVRSPERGRLVHTHTTAERDVCRDRVGDSMELLGMRLLKRRWKLELD
jgi:hypothetical protein